MFEARYYQSEAEYAIFDYFANNSGNPIVAMPTGTGKGVVIGNFIKRVLQQWPEQKFLMLTHVKELIEQNAIKLKQLWVNAPIGIYSAGLNSRDTANPILFGGIQSVSKAIEKGVNFGFRDLIIIDEAHLLSTSDTTMYQKTITALKQINPNLKVIGFTATPYRLKQGLLTESGLFTDVCYDVCSLESFNRLIAEGYISTLIPQPTQTEINLTEVGLVAGEYNNKQLENATDNKDLLYKVCAEMAEKAHNRKHWLIFTSGISSAEHTAEILQSFGLNAAAVHSKLKKKENDARIAAFKSGELRILVNKDMLTTGFDFPPIDFIGMLRATLSPGLWVQMLGRGTRPSPGKQNCLVLDFPGNVKRLGPINDPVLPRKPGKGGGEAPVRICEKCGTYNHASARFCILCNEVFSFKPAFLQTSNTAELVKGDEPIIEYLSIQKVIYNLHEKIGSPPSMKVSYFCGLKMYNEWVCFEHKGNAKNKALQWWQQRHVEAMPETTQKALQKVSQLRVPRQLKVWVNKRYPEILGCEW